MNYLTVLSSAASTSGANTQTSVVATLIQLLPILLIVVVFYFFLIRPQKKKEKEVAEMRSNIQVGDEVTTAGGIIGRVVSIREDTVVIETGSERSKVRIARWAIQQNNTANEQAAAEAAAEKEKSAKK